MRRFLSTFLTFALIAGTIASTVSVTAEETTLLDAEFTHMVKVLNDVGALKSVSGTVQEEEVKRADFVIAIMNLTGYPEDDSPAPYLDTQGAAEGVISAATKLGLVSGSGDGFFYPENPISLNEALKITLIALGYQANAVAAGGYPQGYYATANGLGLLKQIQTRPRFIWNDAIRLLYNAIDADYQVAATYGESITYKKSGTILSQCLDIYKIRAVLQSAGNIHIIANRELMEGQIMIGEQIYEAPNINCQNLLGYSVNVYYHKAHGSDIMTVKSIFAHSSNKEIFISADDIDEFKDGNYIYADSRDRRITTSVKQLRNVVYNGVPDAVNIVFKPDNGWVKLIDNNGDGIYDVAIINDYRNVVVDGVNAFEFKVYDKYYTSDIKTSATQYDATLDLDPNQHNVRITDTDGMEVSVNELGEWAVLSVSQAVSLNGQETIGAVVSRDFVEGEVLEVNSYASGTTVNIDGVEYQLAAEYERRISVPSSAVDAAVITFEESLSPGDRGTFYLDAQGRIAARKGAVKTGAYGYLLAYGFTQDMDSLLQLKLYSSITEKIEILTVGSRVKINDILYRNNEDVLNKLLETGGDRLNPVKEDISQVVFFNTNEADEITTLETLLPDTIYGESLNSPSGEPPTLVEVDNFGRADREGLRLIAAPRSPATNVDRYNYKSSIRTWSLRMYFTANTIVLTVPDDPSIADDKNTYRLALTAIGNDRRENNIWGYTTVKDSPYAEFAVTKISSSGVDADTQLCAVSKVSKMLNKDDEDAHALHLMGFNRDANYVLSDAQLLNYVIKNNTTNARIPHTIQVGDLVRSALNSNGEIDSISLNSAVLSGDELRTLLSEDELRTLLGIEAGGAIPAEIEPKRMLIKDTITSTENSIKGEGYLHLTSDSFSIGDGGYDPPITGRSRVVMTDVTGKYQSILRITTNKDIANGGNASTTEPNTRIKEHEYHLGTNYTTFIVEPSLNNNPVMKGSYNDAAPVDIDPTNSRVVIFTQWGEPRSIFIVKD